MPEGDEFAGRALPHVSIDAFRNPGQYRFSKPAANRKPKRADYHAHAEVLLEQLAAALGGVPAPQQDQRLPIAGLRPGAIVEIDTLVPAGDRIKASKKFRAPLIFPVRT